MHRTPERTKWGREIVERQTRRLLHLVDDLLDISRITRDNIGLRCERVDLATIVRESLQNLRPLIEERKLTLTVHLPPDPVWLDGDALRLGQVFNNLLSNAAWYTNEPGASK